VVSHDGEGEAKGAAAAAAKEGGKAEGSAAEEVNGCLMA